MDNNQITLGFPRCAQMNISGWLRSGVEVNLEEASRTVPQALCYLWDLINVPVNIYWNNNYNSSFHLTSNQPKVGKKQQKCHVSCSALTKNLDFGLLELRRNSLTSTRCRIHIFLSGQLLEQTSDTKQQTVLQTWFYPVPASSQKGNQTLGM